MKWNDLQMLECVDSTNVIRKLPSHAIDFLETKLEWISLNNSSSMSRTKPVGCDYNEIEDVEPMHVHCKYYDSSIRFSSNIYKFVLTHFH